MPPTKVLAFNRCIARQRRDATNRICERASFMLAFLAMMVVEMHGGSLDLQSEVGDGTIVTVRFPAERIVPALIV